MYSKTFFNLILAAALGHRSLAATDIAEAPIVLSITANQSANSELVQGWPLLVTATVILDMAFEPEAAEATLNETAGSWANAIRLTVQNEQGRVVVFPLQIVPAPPGSLTLDGETSGELAWTVSPANTAAIAPGVYVITGGIDSTAVAPPFNNRRIRQSVPVWFRVLPSGGILSEKQFSEQRLLLAGYHVLLNEDMKALQVVDQLLAAQPRNVEALFFRAGLLKLTGRLMDAFDAYAATLGAFNKTAGPGQHEPPFEIYQQIQQVQNDIENMKTFAISIAPKTGMHPYYQQGHEKGYLIEGVQGGELWLMRDSTYTFRMIDIPAGDPFYISTSPAGHGAGVFTSGVTGQPAAGAGELKFTPGSDAPDLLYYQSMAHDDMGWRLHIYKIEAASSVETGGADRTFPEEYRLTFAYPNPFNPQTRFGLDVRRAQHVIVNVFDVQGREVARLFDGQAGAFGHQDIVFDGNGLASGVYVIQVKGEHFSETRRVMLMK
jgi:hypothetical protein